MNTANNLTIHPRQDNVAQFYDSASLVLNLSDKEQFIETFGLTALEAMAAGLPVIVPTVGGISEMVEDDVNGYKIDVAQLDEVSRAIERILTDRDLYMRLSRSAAASTKHYDVDSMIDRIAHCIEDSQER